MRYLLRLAAAAMIAALLGAGLVTVAMRTWPKQVQVHAGWHGPIAVPPLDGLRVTSSFGRRGVTVHAGVDLEGPERARGHGRDARGAPPAGMDDDV